MPWCRRSQRVADVLPLMYLRGVSSGDFAPALSEFFGSAAGLSASVVTPKRSLADVDYVHCWADGVRPALSVVIRRTARLRRGRQWVAAWMVT